MELETLKLKIENSCPTTIEKSTVALNRGSIDQHSEVIKMLYEKVVELSGQVSAIKTLKGEAQKLGLF